jgi:hypothetical protein
MSEMIQKEIEINGKVPKEVKERVRGNLKDREIDFSDIPELTGWLESPVVIKVSLDNDTAKFLSAKAEASHLTPAQVITQMLKEQISVTA